MKVTQNSKTIGGYEGIITIDVTQWVTPCHVDGNMSFTSHFTHVIHWVQVKKI
jgi:hypothetical protein